MGGDIDSFLKKNNFSVVLSTVYGDNTPGDGAFTLRRVAVERDDDPLMFRIKLSGLGALFAPVYSFLFE